MKRFTAKKIFIENLCDSSSDNSFEIPAKNHSFDIPSKKLPQIFSAPSSARGSTQDNKENSTRLPKVEAYLKELFKITTESDIQGLTRYYETEFFNSILAITDNLFSLYNIKINIISVEENDSALCITPATNLKMIVRCLYCIAELVTKLPFTLVRAIDLNKFTVCGKINLLKDNYKSVYENRVYSNAMFGIYDLKTYDQIEKHFYKIILSKMQKKDASMGYEWPADSSTVKLPPLSTGKVPRTRSIYIAKLSSFRKQERQNTFSFTERDTPKSVEREQQEKTKLVKDKQKEQIEVLRQLFNNTDTLFQGKISRVNNETRFIKERIEAIDSVGYTSGWWEEIGRLITPNAEKMFASGCLFD